MKLFEKEFLEFCHQLNSNNLFKNITNNSKKIVPGGLFFAIKGTSNNGNLFIKEAFELGAKIVITDQQEYVFNDNVILVWDARKAFALAAGILYPLVPQNIVAITGTNGKTSVANYFMQICHYCGFKSAAIGTMGVTSLDKEVESVFSNLEITTLTSPGSLEFRFILNKLAQMGVSHVAFEASSHAIDQERFYGVRVDHAAFTSFSREHLDYHLTMENYLGAKLKLFSHYLQATAVIPKNIFCYDQIVNFCKMHNKELFIVENLNDQSSQKSLGFKILHSSFFGQEVEIFYLGYRFEFFTNIISEYQIYNLLISASLASKFIEDFNDIVKSLAKIKVVNGRLEYINPASSFSPKVFVDYAHTPDGLLLSLKELKALKDKDSKLIVVFGCGGERDRGKRPEMGRIASEIADLVIVTDDNPRNEAAKSIRNQIISGINGNYVEIGDRADAIAFAINNARVQDIIIIAGKGHENYQLVAGEVIDFDDKLIALNFLRQNVDN